MTKKPLQSARGSLRSPKKDVSFQTYAPKPAFIEAGDVADMIGYSSGAEFLRNREDLERDQDFPLPFPTCKRPLKWRRSQIRAWIARQGTPRSAQTRPRPNCNQDMLDEARRA